MGSHSRKRDWWRIELIYALENNKDSSSETAFSKIYQIGIYSDLMGLL